MAKSVLREMKSLGVRAAGKTYPTGNKNFAVMQPWPHAFSAEEADPFLMCDEFGPTLSKGLVTDEDEFPVGWHPHRGMDIMTYLIAGTGRHADSLGNRGTFQSPGMQWISVGSGIEHAEGGGTPAGQPQHGFQIWLNVPAARKMEDPRYGTVNPEDLPDLKVAAGVKARLLAGELDGKKGPFITVQSVQILDVRMEAKQQWAHTLPAQLDNCLLYVYQGELVVAGSKVKAQQAVRLDASNKDVKGMLIRAADKNGASFLLFAGKRLNEPIAWHGPFVMNTQDEIRQVFREMQTGRFPPKRAPWNYR
eukprot:g60663.t1